MKKKLLKLLSERKEICITQLYELMPEIKGEYGMFMPVKAGLNPNVLWLGGVSQEFIHLYNKLWLEEKVIDWEPVNIWEYLFEGAPIPTLPIVSKRKIKLSKKVCWMPIKIKLLKK